MTAHVHSRLQPGCDGTTANHKRCSVDLDAKIAKDDVEVEEYDDDNDDDDDDHDDYDDGDDDGNDDGNDDDFGCM